MELPKSRYGLYQHDKVLKDGKPVGVLTRADLLSFLAD